MLRSKAVYIVRKALGILTTKSVQDDYDAVRTYIDRLIFKIYSSWLSTSRSTSYDVSIYINFAIKEVSIAITRRAKYPKL